ncbi:MAG: hypothetical protein J6T15_04170 [Bacilli bacterium]|nr:hypothetical protein [Bacilli bacterium]
MNFEKKSYYFIKDKFFIFANDVFLLGNKENGHGRPCLLIEIENKILWFVPISSKIEKYKKLYAKKLKKYGFCNTIIFGTLFDKECVFLLQNMFPVTQKYVKTIYLDRVQKVPISIEHNLFKQIASRFNQILDLVRKGNKSLVFPNILEIERRLKDELIK